MILGELAPSAGEIEIGSRTMINYVDQGRLLLDEDKTIWDEVGGGQEYVRLGDENVSLRGYLRRFLFAEDRVNTKIRLLSGGERSRVILAKILKRGGNVIILDEPTNDLDLATLRLLEEALVLFTGSILVVSHDRWFLNRICTHILAFQGDGRTLFDAGDYDTYLAKWAGRPPAKEAPKAVAAAAAPAPVARKEKARRLTWKEGKELESIEATIQTAEAEVARLEAIFVDPEFHLKYAKDALAFQTQLQTAKDRVTALYGRWEELEALKRAEAGA
jgi:ATP-binding cassette subfamily F protein uup